jgi:hypothetical protein
MSYPPPFITKTVHPDTHLTKGTQALNFHSLFFSSGPFNNLSTLVILKYHFSDYIKTMSIPIHPLTQNPTAAWKELSGSQKVIKINVQPPKTQVDPKKVGAC